VIGKSRTLRDIAAEIQSDWPVINNHAAKQALDQMKSMGSIEAPFHRDPNGYAVVGVFLENARGWQGKVAKRVKSELRAMCGHPKP
jgi:hypothetical protein